MSKVKAKYRSDLNEKNSFVIQKNGLYHMNFQTSLDSFLQNNIINSVNVRLKTKDSNSMLSNQQVYGSYGNHMGTVVALLHKNDRIYIEQSAPGNAQILLKVADSRDDMQCLYNLRTRILR